MIGFVLLCFDCWVVVIGWLLGCLFVCWLGGFLSLDSKDSSGFSVQS